MEKTTLATKYVYKKAELIIFFCLCGILLGLFLYFAISESLSNYPSTFMLTLDAFGIVLTIFLIFFVIYYYKKQKEAPEVIVGYSNRSFIIYTNRRNYVTIPTADLMECEPNNLEISPVIAGKFTTFICFRTNTGSLIFRTKPNPKSKKIKSFPVCNINLAVTKILNILSNTHE